MDRLKNIDLSTLLCLEALIAERSVSRAAERVGMSQPGMSNTLARLRRQMGDQLLISTPRGMIPTPRALEIVAVVKQARHALDAVLEDRGPFDCAKATGTVRIAAADYAGQRLMPAVMQRIAVEAPGLVVDLRTPDPNHVREALEEGDCDMFVGHFPEAPALLRMSRLFDEPVVCISRRNHPLIRGALTLDIYARCRHVVFGSPFAGTSTLESTVCETLKQLGVDRHVAMRVPSVLLPAHMVAGTDLIATIGEGLALRSAETLPIAVHSLPFDPPRISMNVVWHERTHQSGMHLWVRQVLRDVSSALDARANRVFAEAQQSAAPP